MYLKILRKMFGFLKWFRSGDWFVEYKEGFYPNFFTSIYPLAPWIEVDDDGDPDEIIVAFMPVLVSGRIHAEII